MSERTSLSGAAGALALLLGAACATTPVAAPQAWATQDTRCALDGGVPAERASPGAVVLFGEFHGTRELPALFGEAACALAQGGTPVTVALELPRSEQAALDAYLGSPGDPAAEQRLLAGAFWNRPLQDGRSSRAMADLLSRLRRLRQGGLPIEVVLFDVEQAAMGADRDARMADHLAASLRAHPERATLALMGNLHARTVPGAPWDPDQRFLGWHLLEAGFQVLSLHYDGPPGTAWACFGDAPSACGVKPLGRAAARPPLPLPGIHLQAGRTAEGHHGTFAVGALTASPPAVGP